MCEKLLLFVSVLNSFFKHNLLSALSSLRIHSIFISWTDMFLSSCSLAALIGRLVGIRVHSDSYWRRGPAGRSYWWSDWGCQGDWEEVGGQAQQRMGQGGVVEARGQGRVMEADGCGHGYVRPRNTGNTRGSSHRNLGRLLHILLQLLHVPLKLGSSVLEPANNLEINFVGIFLW